MILTYPPPLPRLRMVCYLGKETSVLVGVCVCAIHTRIRLYLCLHKTYIYLSWNKDDWVEVIVMIYLTPGCCAPPPPLSLLMQRGRKRWGLGDVGGWAGGECYIQWRSFSRNLLGILKKATPPVHIQNGGLPFSFLATSLGSRTEICVQGNIKSTNHLTRQLVYRTDSHSTNQSGKQLTKQTGSHSINQTGSLSTQQVTIQWTKQAASQPSKETTDPHKISSLQVYK